MKAFIFNSYHLCCFSTMLFTCLTPKISYADKVCAKAKLVKNVVQLSTTSATSKCPKGTTELLDTSKIAKTVGDQLTKNGTQGPAGKDGKDGAPGANGSDGSPDTPSQVLSKIMQVDGNGSGLDADTVDGQNASQIISAASASSSAIIFTHWGHKGCPAGASLVYTGIAAGTHRAETGGGSNILCLRTDPIFDNSIVNTGGQDGANVYGLEYETGRYDPPSLAAQVDLKVACAVCVRDGAKVVFMQPGRNDCPNGFAPEYDGILMASQYIDSKSEFICVDKLLQGDPSDKGSAGGYDTAMLYPAQAKCGAAGAPAGGNITCSVDGYSNNKEITCSVCSK